MRCVLCVKVPLCQFWCWLYSCQNSWMGRNHQKSRCKTISIDGNHPLTTLKRKWRDIPGSICQIQLIHILHIEDRIYFFDCLPRPSSFALSLRDKPDLVPGDAWDGMVGSSFPFVISDSSAFDKWQVFSLWTCNSRSSRRSGTRILPCKYFSQGQQESISTGIYAANKQSTEYDL